MRHNVAHYKEAVLDALAKTGNVSLACCAAGVGRRTHYNWLKTDSEYEAAAQEAIDDAGDLLAAVARKRAVEGWDEPVYQGGKLVGHIRRYSDRLLMFLLCGINPARWSEKYRAAMLAEGKQTNVQVDVEAVRDDLMRQREQFRAGALAEMQADVEREREEREALPGESASADG